MLKNLTAILFGAAAVLLVLGFTTGLIPKWLKARFVAQEEVVKEEVKPSVTPTPKPKVVEEVEDESYAPTTKGGVALGEATSIPQASYITLVYEFKTKDASNWQIRANYDTRYETTVDFDEVSPSYDRRVTVCQVTSNGIQKCESMSTDPGLHQSDFVLASGRFSYEIKKDTHGPSALFEGPWQNGNGEMCVRAIGIKDDISPLSMLKIEERMDNGAWRDLHSEYCMGSTGSHRYELRLKDERGNETVTGISFGN